MTVRGRTLNLNDRIERRFPPTSLLGRGYLNLNLNDRIEREEVDIVVEGIKLRAAGI